MRANAVTPVALDRDEAPELFTESEEHRGWTVVVAVKRLGERFWPEIFVRSPGTLSGTCIPHGGLYVTEHAARDAGLRIGSRWVDCHGIAD